MDFTSSSIKCIYHFEANSGTRINGCHYSLKLET
jgi:hypothetical protein